VTIRLSPLVVVYPFGSARPPVPEQGLALPELASEAFGDGSHPTTRLTAGAVDLLCRQRRPRSVLDVGTGTGILARIARARGARRVVATDIDPVALAAARANAALDGADIEVSDRAPDSWGPSFDLVVANILEGPLRELAPALARALAPGGALLLSGFTSLQLPGLRVAFASQGLRGGTESVLEEWALLHYDGGP
jgi:ribosomal protein L11 methyltransferase